MSGFSATLLEHFANPKNGGILAEANAKGTASLDGLRPSMTVYLCIREGRVIAASYQTTGCGVMIATGSMLTELIVGQSVSACHVLTGAQIAEALGGVPPHKSHCPELAVEALQDALSTSPGCTSPE